jgi:hypothetical protein
MTKTKKDTSKGAVKYDPVNISKKKKDVGQTVSGHPESDGGSRQGNAGHEHSSESGRGDRQV